MLALYRCGRQAEALEAFRNARQTLVDEIGVEPSPELRRLHDAILRQDPSLDVEPAEAELPRELDASAAPPLVGRDDELRVLRACWQHAAAGAGALVTLVGAYGMGKTRLAAEIASDAHREGAAVLYAAGTGPPEAALAAIARAREARRPALVVLDDADRAPAEVRAALRELGAGARPPAGAGARHRAGGGGARTARAAGVARARAARRRERPGDRRLLRPGRRGDAVPVETLLATSRGVARRVHEAAGEWARREATRRVDAAAGRAAAGRSEARALEAELAGSVVELQSTRERAGLVRADGDDAVAPAVCPYKGLATFDAEDAEYFFGREQLVAELVARLVGAPLLAVVGPSGSGKSSVLRAGLLPALAGGVLPGSDELDAGADPSRRAADARARPRDPAARARVARRARGRPVRGAVHRVPGRDGAGTSSSPRSCASPAIATAAASSCSPCARTSTAAAPPTPSCRACSAPTTCSSGRCRATSSRARSSAPPNGSA